MADAESALLLGEHPRTLDDRYRLSIPSELTDRLLGPEGVRTSENCILTKERPGALALWSPARWRPKFESGVRLIEEKMRAGRLDGRIDEVQWLGRLLSTRHTEVLLAGKGRLVLPEGFREFLGVSPGGEAIVVGAGVCIEIWRPDAWFRWIDENMPEFRKRFDQLAD